MSSNFARNSKNSAQELNSVSSKLSLEEEEQGMKTIASVDSFTPPKLAYKSAIEPIKETETVPPSLLRFFSTPKFISRQFQQESEPEAFVQVEVDMDEPLTLEEEKDLWITSRLKHTRQQSAESAGDKNSWFKELSAGFTKAKESFMGTQDGPSGDAAIDWDFWGRVINDYEKVVGQNPQQFHKNMQQGIPEPIRGMMWQLMSNSKSEQLENEYIQLLTRTSRNEKIIIRDLARTFPGHPFFVDPKGPGQTGLFNVLKAYSLYDQEIGYCQGLPFVVGPLLLNMPEEQAFCVLVKLMFEYNFRDLYTPKMLGLQVLNHQFDKLLEGEALHNKEQFPQVHKHLENQDIKSTMYASQWFMTLFAYRFPLEIVFRILDVIFAEGSQAVLRFALALVKHNANQIVTMDFEKLLEYLKEGLFDKYVDNVNQLVQDASSISISKRKLDRWSKEYLEVLRLQSPEVLEAEKVKEENRMLTKNLKRLQNNLESLNREHVDLVNKYMQEKQKHEIAREHIEDLEEQVRSLKSILALDRKGVEDQVKKETDELADKNIQLININSMLEDTIASLEQKLLKSRNLLADSQNEKEDLIVKLRRFEKVRIGQ